MKSLNSQEVQNEILKIATNHLDIQTLDTQENDYFDFHDLSVCQIRSALVAAYELGQSLKNQ